MVMTAITQGAGSFDQKASVEPRTMIASDGTTPPHAIHTVVLVPLVCGVTVAPALESR